MPKNAIFHAYFPAKTPPNLFFLSRKKFTVSTLQKLVNRRFGEAAKHCNAIPYDFRETLKKSYSVSGWGEVDVH